MASRIIFGMGDQGVMPGVFAKVHEGRRTPWVAIIFTTLIAVALISTGSELETLATTTVVLLLLVFIMVNTSVLVLRRDPVEHEHFRAPSVFPILGIVVALALLIYQAASDITVFALAGILLLGAVVLWGVNVLVKRRLDRQAPEPPQ
jgi:amino acid transporter